MDLQSTGQILNCYYSFSCLVSRAGGLQLLNNFTRTTVLSIFIHIHLIRQSQGFDALPLDGIVGKECAKDHL